MFADFAATFARAGAALTTFSRLVKAHEKGIASGLSVAETRALIELLEMVRSAARSL